MNRTRSTLAALASVIALWAAPALAIVFWFDDRVPYEDASYEDRRDLLGPAGGIFCTDGTTGTGFLVDVSAYLAESLVDTPQLHILVSSAKVLLDQQNGYNRAICAFRPSSVPDVLVPIGERLAGLSRVGFMDPNDWVFAKLEESGDLPKGLVLDFDAANEIEEFDEVPLWAVGYDKTLKNVAISDDCEKGALRVEKTPLVDPGPQPFLIHNCDLYRHARGGPIAIRTPAGYRVVGIHTGNSLEEKFENLHHIPFDPGRNFFNYGRRLDDEMENKLVAFISRFAELRSPSETIHAQRVLVRAIQANLLRLGYDIGEADGLLGQRSSDAIRAFQTSLGINPTGLVSEELLLLLQAR